MQRNILFVLFFSIVSIGLAEVKVSILGDSYSTYNGWVPEGYAIWYGPGRGNDVQDVNDTWWKKLIDDNGLQLEKNNSWSGATICNTGYRGEDYSDRSFLNRSSDLGDNPDIIYVFGGTNDAWANVPLGELNGDDTYAFRPATKLMLQNIKKVYPEALCIVIINTELSKDIVTSIVEACNLEDVPYVQLEAIDKQTGHPSISGMNQISKQVWKHTAPLLYNHLKNQKSEIK